MAQIYAALKMEMGSWLYYSVKMKMSEVASEIKFAYEASADIIFLCLYLMIVVY